MSSIDALATIAKWDKSAITQSGEGKYIVTCPFAPKTHSKGIDRHPSMLVNILQRDYHCFSCKSTGSLYTYNNHLSHLGLTPLSADSVVEWFKALVAIPKVVAKDNHAKEGFKPLPLVVYNAHYPSVYSVKVAQAYLTSRNVTEVTCRRLHVTYDTERGAIRVPYVEDTSVVGYGCRVIAPVGNEPKVKYPKFFHKADYLLGAHLYRHGKPILLVEGLFAYLRSHDELASRWYNILALGGSTPSERQIEKLLNYDAPVYVLLDADKAGTLGTNRLKKELGGNVPLFIPNLPTVGGLQDVDLLTKHHYRQFLQTTLPYSATTRN